MLAYAASRSAAGRQSSPNTMLFIIAGHVAALAVVMSAKMDLPHRIFDPPIKVDTIRMPDERPQPQPQRPREVAHPEAQPMTRSESTVPLPQPFPVEQGPPPADPGPAVTGPGAATAQPLPQPPRPVPINRGPQLLTAGADLKPPYPAAKQAIGEEATLTLRLGVDEGGRVMTVDPVGRADPVFAEAARRHIIMHWRFRPASYGGRPAMSWTVITLSFRLDD